MQRAAAVRTYAAVFQVQLYDGPRAAAAQTIRGWARMTPAAAGAYEALVDQDASMEDMLEVAEVFGFRTWLEHYLSAGGL